MEKLIEDTFGVPVQNWQAVAVNPPNRTSISFEAVEFLDPHSPVDAPNVYVAYVHQSVGVVFHVLNKNREAAKPSLQMSMETYADDGDAYKAQAAFNKRKGR